MSTIIEDDKGVLNEFPAVTATENKVVPLRVIKARSNSVELEIEVHHIGFPPEIRNVTIPSSNKLLIEQHLKEIWAELKPSAETLETLSEVKINE